jgi:hypothetical protein
MLLLQLVRTVDKHQQSMRKLSDQPAAAAGGMTTEAVLVTTRVLNEYVQALKQLNQPLSWAELEMMSRFLSLKLSAKDWSGLEALISRIDEALAVHGAAPENPVDYVEFLKIRELVFGASEDLSRFQEDNRQKWLQTAARFLDTARRSELESPARQSFLDARCEALRRAYYAGQYPVQFSSQEARKQLTDYLSRLIEVLREPIPGKGDPRNAERELLMEIQRYLNSGVF